MPWIDWFDVLSDPPERAAFDALREITGPRAGFLDFYKRHDGGAMDTTEAHVRFMPIATVLHTRDMGNAGWPPHFLFFAENGVNTGFGLLLGPEDVYFAADWEADDDDYTCLGNFPAFVARLRAGAPH
ncbi:MAG: hypothetical protein AAGH68_07200 [Pseudomonadota bacterium]